MCKIESGGASFGCVYLDIWEVRASSSHDLACTDHTHPSMRETSAFSPWGTLHASP